MLSMSITASVASPNYSLKIVFLKIKTVRELKKKDNIV
jgi:hypothetical protein